MNSLSVFAQDSSCFHQSARVEIGAGIGVVELTPSGRIAVSYLHSNWGGVLRASAHIGKQGEEYGWFGARSREKLYDNGILLSYILSNRTSRQVIASAGIGFLYGERLDGSKSLEKVDSVTGFAFEIGVASAGSTKGWSINLIGNINSESDLIAILYSFTLGYQK